MEDWIYLEPGNLPILTPQKDVDYHNFEDLSQALQQLVLDGHQRIVLDLRHIQFMDSSGLSVLMAIGRQLAPYGLVLRRSSPAVVHALKVTGLHRFFRLEETGTPGASMPAEAYPEPGRLANLAPRPVRSPGSHAEKRVIHYPARLLSVAAIREQVVALSANLPFTTEEKDDIRMAVGEACSNAVRHGSPDPARDQVVITCQWDRNGFEVSVQDCGPGFRPEAVPVPAMARGGSPLEASEGGMGLYFIRLLMDEVEITCNEGTLVRMVKRPGAHSGHSSLLSPAR